MMRRKFITLATIAFTGSLTALPVWSACSPDLHFVGGNQIDGTLIDFDGEGRSAGDLHVGSRALLDKEGNDAGRIYWVNTTLTPDSARVEAVFDLPDGEIHYSGLVIGLDGARNETSTQFNTITGVIQGGTGAYLHATGMVEVDLVDQTPQYRLTMRCS